MFFGLIFTSFSASITEADTKLSAFSKHFGLFKKSFADIKNDTKAYKSLLSGIFETGLTNNDISVLKNYANQVHTLGALLKNGNITQEQYSSNLARLKNEFTGVTTSAQATAIKIDLLEAEFADGKIGIAEYQAKMKVLEGEMQTTSVLAEVMGTALRTAFNVGLMIVINLIITGIMEMAQAEEKAIENSKEIANKAKEEATALDDLRKSYFDTKEAVKNNTKTKEDLTEITDTLLKRLGVELDTVEDLTTEYGNLDNAINQITADNIINDILPGMAEGIVAARKELLDTASKDLGFSESNDAVIKYLEKWNEEHGNPFYHGGKYYGKENFSFNNRQTKNVHALDYNETDALNAITEDIKVYTQLLSDMNKKNLEGSDAYSQVNNRLKLLKEQYQALTTAISENNDKTAEAVLLRGNTLNKGLPKTFEAYEKYRENIIKLAQSDEFVNLFKGTAEDIETSIAKQLSSNKLISAYEQRFQDIQSLTQKAVTDNIEIDEVKKYLSSLTDDELEIVKQIPNIFEQGLDGITQKIQEWKNKPENQIAYTITSLSERITELKKSYDDAFSNQDTIQKAFDKIQEGTSLTSDEMLKLIEVCDDVFPEIGSLFKKTADGYTISADDLIRANDAIIKSAKDVIQADKETIENRQRAIEVQLNNPLANDSRFADTFKALRKEYAENENQLKALDLILSAFGLTLDTTTEKVNAFDKAIEDSTKSISLIKTAMEEMSNDGHISASTYQALVEKGEDYVACLELVDGKLTLNITKLKELEVQELRNIISKNNLRISELEAQKAHGGTAEVIDKETQALARQNAVLEQQIQDVWSTTGDSGSGSSSDSVKEAFEKDMKDIEHLHNMGLKSDEEYYDALEKANEKHYKNSAEHESDYLSNVEKIYNARQSLYKDSADKQFDDLEDQRKRGIITAEQYAQGLHDLGQELYGKDSIYGGTEFAIKALEELDKQVKEVADDIYSEFKEGLSADGDKTLFNVLSDAEELWNKTNELFDGDLTLIKSNAKDIFGTVSSALEDALKKGIITVDGYESLLRSWADTLQVTEADITDALVDTYEYRANALQKANDGSLASERKYIADMKALNFSTYGDENSDFYDPATYASNLRDITDHQLDVLKKALNDGEISVQEYANSVVEIFKDADVLGADYVSEKLDDIDKVRAEREKTYWEQQKELMEDYYDKQIKEIEETQKAKEKKNKLEELHLKLIKARQTLEEAKNNRNQLVFHDGTFEYMADQDAIMSAEEEVTNTLKEIEDEKLQAQIDLLEEQKDAALGFYDQILDEIDFYLNKTLPLSESDQEELAKIRNSDYAQYARDKRDGNLAANSDNEKIAEDALNQTDTAEETKQSVSDIAKNVLDIAKIVANGFNFENLVRALGGNPTAEAVKNFQDSYNATLVGKQITPSTLPSNITNNSNTTNNNNNKNIVVNVGDIHITVPEGMSKEDIAEYVAGRLSESIALALPKYLI